MNNFGIVALSCLCLTTALKLPSYLKACSRSDPNFNKCALESAKAAIPSVIKGDKKYGIPSLNPLILPLVDLHAGDNFHLKFKNLEVRGLEKSEIKKLNVDPQKEELSIVIQTPVLDLYGDYRINGKILVLPIEGEGKANVTFTSPVINCDITWFDKENDKGVLHAQIKSKKGSYSVQHVKYHFDNLFNGDEKLGKELNNVMNENWEVVGQDLRAPLSEILTQICSTIVTGYFKNVPYNEIVIS